MAASFPLFYYLILTPQPDSDFEIPLLIGPDASGTDNRTLTAATMVDGNVEVLYLHDSPISILLSFRKKEEGTAKIDPVLHRKSDNFFFQLFGFPSQSGIFPLTFEYCKLGVT